MTTVLGVSGSPRPGGNSDILLQSILEGAAVGGAETKAVFLREYQFQGCIGCERCRKDGECTALLDGMQLLYPKIRESHGLVLVSPIYSYNVTALMKAFIDRLYAFYHFDNQRPGHWHSRIGNEGRKAVLAVVGEQANVEDGGIDLTMAVMRRSITALGCEIAAEVPVLGVFQKGGVREQPQSLEQARAAGSVLAAKLQGA
jgi:multimeric flavodoxin WrbA